MRLLPLLLVLATFALPARANKLDCLRETFAAIAEGKRTHSYYSAFGSSYHRDPIEQLTGYLELGAKLSPRGWNLFEKIRAEALTPLSDRELAKVIVEYLNPSTLDSPARWQGLNSALKSPQAARLILDEVKAIQEDARIFTKNLAEVFEIFNRVDDYHAENRDLPWFRQASREVSAFKRTPLFRDYRENYIRNYRERWNDSFDPLPREESSALSARVKAMEQDPRYASLSTKAREILSLQLQREAAGRFHSNYGGLYNRRDRSFVWYAAGEKDFARESFDSIQGYFSKDGLTFEFTPEAQARIQWQYSTSLQRKAEMPGLAREPFTYDHVSMSGNLIPGDVRRVYASNPEILGKARAAFEASLGKAALEQSGITFHLAEEQSRIHAADTDAVIQRLGLGSPELPLVKPVVAGKVTYFLSEAEINAIRARKRPLKYLVALDGGQEGMTSLKTLIERHAQIDGNTPVTAKLFTGGWFSSPDSKTPVYLNPAEQMELLDFSQNVHLEFRPEVSEAQIKQILESKFTRGFDFGMVSRIYFPSPKAFDAGRNHYFDHFGVQSKFRWGQDFAMDHDLKANYAADSERFTRALETPRNRALNLDRAQGLSLNPAESISLKTLSERDQVRKFLISSQNFGIDTYQDLTKVMSAEEYKVWLKLQDKVMATARRKAPLTAELVDEFNGRGTRALLSYLFLSEGIPPPSFERISAADMFTTGEDYLRYVEMGILRGAQSIRFGGPPRR